MMMMMMMMMMIMIIDKRILIEMYKKYIYI
jgi:hypothetical protein